ncbi:hypothetical protein RCL_jg6630.t1 [Rhizophagus clarus]|uniref:Uncharacterized protein n=1 Tax=Rhizophagus clarus TaxID=94130 RepID=A0A8H3LFB4_9GLOM|nr:hypothetical protein RCL_jg6630.t1 [Rhizophagus clarus]
MRICILALVFMDQIKKIKRINMTISKDKFNVVEGRISIIDKKLKVLNSKFEGKSVLKEKSKFLMIIKLIPINLKSLTIDLMKKINDKIEIL